MICIFLGTRPEIIKMSPIVRELRRRKKKFFLVHTNQHFSENMDKDFFNELKIPRPDYNLNLVSRSHGEMVGELIAKAEKVFIKEEPQCVLVEGDTDSVLAGAISAWKLGIKVGHVEAGLRSYDRGMPEELNRKLSDHISDFLFCPTKLQKKILLGEAVDKNRIFITGNTIVDAVRQNLKLLENKKKNRLDEKYMLLTLHRPSNVDNKKNFNEIVNALSKLSLKLGLPICFPIHPRTRLMARKFNITFDKKRYTILPPIGYLQMMAMEKNASLILTDSGGVQEEACILRVPCVTIRNNTERPETLKVGSNIVSGVSENGIIESSIRMIRKKRNWENPFGDGKTAEKIVSILERAGIA